MPESSRIDPSRVSEKSPSALATAVPLAAYELVQIGEPASEEQHLSGLVLVASRTYTVADPGNLLAWMSDEIDVKTTVEEERLQRLKAKRRQYLQAGQTGDQATEEESTTAPPKKRPQPSLPVDHGKQHPSPKRQQAQP